MNQELIIAVVGVAVAITTGIFGFLAGKKSDESKYVIQQRLDWRNHIREWVKDISTHIESFNTSVNTQDRIKERIIINALLNDVKGRVNPSDDKKIILMLNELYIEDNSKNVDVIKFRTIVAELGKLLKEDWEETKKSVRIFANLSIIDLVFLGYTIRWIFDNITPNVLANFDDFFRLVELRSLLMLMGLEVFYKIVFKLLKENHHYRHIYRPKVKWYTIIEWLLALIFLYQANDLHDNYEPDIGTILMISAFTVLLFMVFFPGLIVFINYLKKKSKLKKEKTIEGKTI